jgi:predicted metal-dependent RNase
MSVQDDKDAGQEEGQQLTEKPQPDEDQKKKAAEMMTAYEDRPTLVLPGTGGMVSGTAVNDWLDEEGNPKQEAPDDVGTDAKGSDGKQSDEKATKEQIEKDKAWNEELKKAAEQENKGEKG